MSSEKGRRFSHLRWKDRLKIERMLKEGHKVKEIAAALRSFDPEGMKTEEIVRQCLRAMVMR